MRSYYASKISSNISETPEGFLICRNAPIARTGQQTYFRHELGFPDNSNQEVEVNRNERDVFSPQTIASFEGKPVTDDHPYGDQVTSENAAVLLKGVATNVRRGTGEDKDKLLADLIVYDKLLADEIRAGKRELSCGYDSIIVEGDDGALYQTTIRGNHIAVVEAGRAGSDVCIKDKKPTKQPNQRRRQPMAKKKDPSSVFARLAAAILTDSNPEEKNEVLEEVGQALLAQDENPTDTQPTPSADTTPVVSADTHPATAQDNATLPALLEAVKCR